MIQDAFKGYAYKFGINLSIWERRKVFEEKKH